MEEDNDRQRGPMHTRDEYSNNDNNAFHPLQAERNTNTSTRDFGQGHVESGTRTSVPSTAVSSTRTNQTRQQMHVSELQEGNDNFMLDTSQHSFLVSNNIHIPSAHNSNEVRPQHLELIEPTESAAECFNESFDTLEGERDFLLRAKHESLQDLREEIERVRSEEYHDANEHSSTVCDQMSNDEIDSLALRTPLSHSTPLPPNELRYRAGSADTDVENYLSKRRLERSSDNQCPQMRARSFTAPAGQSPRSTRSREEEAFDNILNSTDRDHDGTNDRDGTTSISSILSSLDTGMNTLRRWMNSRPRLGHNERTISRQSHAVLELSLGEENYFVPDNTNNIPTGIRSSSYHGSGLTDSSVESDSSRVRSLSSHHGRIHYPQTIQEDETIRQRAFSEPERANRPWRAFSRRRRRHDRDPQSLNRRHRSSTSSDVSLIGSSEPSPSITHSSHLESGGNSLPIDFISTSDVASSIDRPNRLSSRVNSEQEHEHGIEMLPSPRLSNGFDEESGLDRLRYDDPNREARRAWIVINQRFQLLLIIVGVIFSVVLFSILVTWVVLTSAYVVSIDEECDLPLKLYFWLATIQLILDLFRKDIMKFIFRFESRNEQNESIPTRVIFYNLGYLTYAMVVLRFGIRIVFLSDGNCRHTATKLFNTTRIFVIISMSAWFLILFGYLLPFFLVAMLLTRNGYSPTLEGGQNGSNFGVFPGSNNGAPPGCIDRLKEVKLDEFQPYYPKECCICMTDFASNDVIVVTECEHVFHKTCCQEWLRQARTCPVCRSDIPDSFDMGSELDEETVESIHRVGMFSRGPFRAHNFQQEMLNLVSILQDSGRR